MTSKLPCFASENSGIHESSEQLSQGSYHQALGGGYDCKELLQIRVSCFNAHGNRLTFSHRATSSVLINQPAHLR
jgi:hypothetical protein